MPDLSLSSRKRLLEMARAAIKSHLETGDRLTLKNESPELAIPRGCFVTIYKNGQLRGCIGNIIGRGPLCLTVRDMAMAAATEDRRFESIRKDEVAVIDIEISVLLKPRVIKNIDEIQGSF